MGNTYNKVVEKVQDVSGGFAKIKMFYVIKKFFTKRKRVLSISPI